MLRLKTGLSRDTPTTHLLARTGDMSVHQLTAYHTLNMVHGIVTSQYPKYLAEKLKLRKPEDGQVFPHRQLNTINIPKVNLNISRSGFIVRGACLWNCLPSEMRAMKKKVPFKLRLRKWIKEKIQVKPP